MCHKRTTLATHVAAAVLLAGVAAVNVIPATAFAAPAPQSRVSARVTNFTGQRLVDSAHVPHGSRFVPAVGIVSCDLPSTGCPDDESMTN
jgi:hypothetical protein